ncbi:hypothetical protein ACHAW6_007165, partial [Cyclotella cf. meneghiniana]
VLGRNIKTPQLNEQFKESSTWIELSWFIFLSIDLSEELMICPCGDLQSSMLSGYRIECQIDCA